MQTIFERSSALANQLAEEVGNQHRRLQYEKAEAELQIEALTTAAEASIRMIEEHARDARSRVTSATREAIIFQEKRLADIEEQLKAYGVVEQQQAA